LIQGLEKAVEDLESLVKTLGKKAEDSRRRLEEELEETGEGIGKTSNVSSQGGSFLARFTNQRPPSEPVMDRKVVRRIWNMAKVFWAGQARLELARKAKREVEGRLGELRELERRLRNRLERLEGEGARKEGPGQDRSPFILTLPPPYEAEKALVGVDEPLREGKEKPALKSLLEDLEGVVSVLLGQGEATLKGWLKGVIEGREEGRTLWEAVERTFRELNGLSAPAWDYQDAWVANPGLGYREEVFILGLEDASDKEDPLVADEDLLSVFAGTLRDRMRLQRVSTGDSNRLLFYKVEASIPAFALRGVGIYRERYEQLRKERSFHVDRRWEETFPDLFPQPSREEVARVWTKARLMGILEGGAEEGYRFPDLRQERGRYKNLGLSPAEAFHSLEADFFAYKELESQVAAKEKGLKRDPQSLEALRQRVAEALENRERLLAEGEGTWRKEDLEVFRLERDVLRGLQQELAQYDPRRGTDDFPHL
jgi:hypothetical protein